MCGALADIRARPRRRLKPLLLPLSPLFHHFWPSLQLPSQLYFPIASRDSPQQPPHRFHLAPIKLLQVHLELLAKVRQARQLFTAMRWCFILSFALFTNWSWLVIILSENNPIMYRNTYCIPRNKWCNLLCTLFCHFQIHAGRWSAPSHLNSDWF